jgi:hypothetical protein
MSATPPLLPTTTLFADTWPVERGRQLIGRPAARLILGSATLTTAALLVVHVITAAWVLAILMVASYIGAEVWMAVAPPPPPPVAAVAAVAAGASEKGKRTPRITVFK